MITTFIITFREVLEAVLIISILYSYLIKTNNLNSFKYINWGIISGISASILGALLFQLLTSGFEGKNAQIFEGVVFLIGALFITTMVLWMIKQDRVVQDLQEKLAYSLKNRQKFGIIFLVFISIFREGIELVVFLSIIDINPEPYGWLGAIFGFIVAFLLGWAMYKGTIRFNLKSFFIVTNLLLILFAAGMIAYGLHELIEAGVVNPIIEPVWDINHFLNDKSTIGSLLKSIFGYNGNPALAEVIAYGSFLLIIGVVWVRISYKNHISMKLP